MGIHINGTPVTVEDFVKAKLIKTPYECPHPENYRITNPEGKYICNLCGKAL